MKKKVLRERRKEMEQKVEVINEAVKDEKKPIKRGKKNDKSNK